MKSYQFEIPYNFDPMLIELLAMFDPMGTMYNCIYVCPYPQDYAATPLSVKISGNTYNSCAFII